MRVENAAHVVRGDDAKTPPRKRKTMSDPMLGARARASQRNRAGRQETSFLTKRASGLESNVRHPGNEEYDLAAILEWVQR